MTKRGLGKGLGALIPTAPAELAEKAASGISHVPVNASISNPLQPRQKQEPTALQELADSIREHGLIQPLIVTAAQAGRDVLLPGGDRASARHILGADGLEAAVPADSGPAGVGGLAED